jgi:hypothetical protein
VLGGVVDIPCIDGNSARCERGGGEGSDAAPRGTRPLAGSYACAGVARATVRRRARVEGTRSRCAGAVGKRVRAAKIRLTSESGRGAGLPERRQRRADAIRVAEVAARAGDYAPRVVGARRASCGGSGMTGRVRAAKERCDAPKGTRYITTGFSFRLQGLTPVRGARGTRAVRGAVASQRRLAGHAVAVGTDAGFPRARKRVTRGIRAAVRARGAGQPRT